MEKRVCLIIALISCFHHAYAAIFLNGKDATSFLLVKRVKRSSSCVSESFCESNLATCSSGSGREVIRENRCNGVSCPFGEKCEIQISNMYYMSVCPSHITGTECATDGTTLRATLIVAVVGLGLVVILMIVITVLIVYRCKRKGKLFPQQEPEAKENTQKSESHSTTAWPPANTNSSNK